MTGVAYPDRLERRYRRLLGCYPADFRARYDEEMIGVLMSTATPEQRRPNAREALDLVVAGLRARLRTSASGAHTPAWRSAFAVFAYLAAAVIATISTYSQVIQDGLATVLTQGGGGRQLTVQLGGYYQSSSPLNSYFLYNGPYISRAGIALAVGWVLILMAVGIGRYRIAAIGAALGVVGQLTAIAYTFRTNPAEAVNEWWRVALAITAAAVLLAIYRVREPRPGADKGRDEHNEGDEGDGRQDERAGSATTSPLSVRTRVVVAVCVLLVGVWPILEGWNVVSRSAGPNAWETYQHISLPRYPMTAAVMVAAYVVILFRLTPAVRRRVMLLGAPAAATLAMVATTFGGFLASSPRFDPPVYPVVPQWIALIVVPLLVWVVGLGLLRRYERRLATGELLA